MFLQRNIPAVLDRHIDAAAGLATPRQAARLETLDKRAAGAGFERVVVDLDEIRRWRRRFCGHVTAKYMAAAAPFFFLSSRANEYGIALGNLCLRQAPSKVQARGGAPMKKLAIATAMAAASVATVANAEDIRARLIGYQEVPSVSTQGSGELRAMISHDEDSIDYELSYSGLEGAVAQSHIHIG